MLEKCLQMFGNLRSDKGRNRYCLGSDQDNNPISFERYRKAAFKGA